MSGLHGSPSRRRGTQAFWQRDWPRAHGARPQAGVVVVRVGGRHDAARSATLDAAASRRHEATASATAPRRDSPIARSVLQHAATREIPCANHDRLGGSQRPSHADILHEISTTISSDGEAETFRTLAPSWRRSGARLATKLDGRDAVSGDRPGAFDELAVDQHVVVLRGKRVCDGEARRVHQLKMQMRLGRVA